MTNYEFELEVRSWVETSKVLRGEKKSGPTSGFFKALNEQLSQIEGEPVTPEELGWDK